MADEDKPLSPEPQELVVDSGVTADEGKALSPEQQKLVMEHLDLVPMIAREMAPKLAKVFKYKDLVSLGHDGLCEAASRADPLLYPAFRRFATLRIRGAMFDAYASRVADDERAAALCQSAACDFLTRRRKGDVMADMDGRAEERLLEHVGGAAASGFAAAVGAVRPEHAEQAMERLQAYARGHAALQRCLTRLKPHEARLIDMKYFQGKTLSEIGQVLKLRHPAAYRLHDRLVVQLHAMLAEEGETELPPREDEL
jgi:RNA polymerase sigma factor for flagellar operon FliA